MWREAVREELQAAQEAGEQFSDDDVEWVLRSRGEVVADTTTDLWD